MSKTALSVLAVLAVVLGMQLIAILTVPVTSGTLKLCEFEDFKFGVFGFCNTVTGQCSSVGIGYDDSSEPNLNLPSNARRTLAHLLVVHVVAAGLTLIMMVMVLVTVLSRAATNSRYLLFVLLFSIPSILISLLAFLVDILLFVQHLSWEGWLVLVATVLLALVTISLWIWRRKLSGQEAMRRRGQLLDANDVGLFTNITDAPLELEEAKFTSFTSTRAGRSSSSPPLNPVPSTTAISYTNYAPPPDHVAAPPPVPPSHYATASISEQAQSTYQQAVSRTYRGNAGPIRRPEEAPVQPLPAGTYPPGVEDDASIRGGYGPNVVALPTIRRGHNQSYQAQSQVAQQSYPEPQRYGQMDAQSRYSQEHYPQDSQDYSQNYSQTYAQEQYSPERSARYARSEGQASSVAPSLTSHAPSEPMPNSSQGYAQNYAQTYAQERVEAESTDQYGQGPQDRPVSHKLSPSLSEVSYYSQTPASPQPGQPLDTQFHQIRPPRGQRPQYYHPVPQAQPQAQPQQSRSDFVLRSNPDFNFAPGRGPRPRPNQAGSDRRREAGATPAAFETADSPYHISRLAGSR